MNVRKTKVLTIILILTLASIILISSSTFTVNRDEFAVVKQFGKVVDIHEEAEEIAALEAKEAEKTEE